jgi:hypothetical protein
MILKSGTAYPEESEPTDAIFEYTEGTRVTISYADGTAEFCLVSIDPEDFLAIADAVRENILFNKKLKNENSRNSKGGY